MIKIKITFFLSLFFTTIGFSQSSTTGVSDNNAQNLSQFARGTSSSNQGYGSAFRFKNPPKTIDGSIYLFDNWNVPATILTKDNKKFSLNNINLNLQRNRIVTKISQDSIFVLDMKKIDVINLLGKSFKKIDSNIGSRIFEVIFESKDFSVLNFHSVKLVEGSVNPMLSRKTDKLIHQESYYLLKGEEITEFRLKKKTILELFTSNESEKNSLMKYYKVNKLSYKNIDDLKSVLSVIDNII